MGKVIFHIIYVQPLYRIVELMFFAILIWIQLEFMLAKKSKNNALWKVLNVVLAIVSVFVIVKATISAERQWTSEVIMIPFYSFVEARIQPEMYRSMLMNVFLFFPFGLSLPYVFPRKWKHQAVWAVFVAMLVSACIEYIQYRYHLGRTEIDDVICNTLGCAIGCISYMLTQKKHLKESEMNS